MIFQDGLTYQESRMATVGEFKEDLSPFDLSDKEKYKCAGGIVLMREGDIVYTDSSDAHSLIVGDTGSMKTLRFVLPLILSSALAGESMLTVDPKGDLSKKTSNFLKEQGYKVVIVDFRNPQKSPDCWNPFAQIADLYYDEEKEKKQQAMYELNDVINSLFYSRTPESKDPYWNESAGQFALGICQMLLMKSKHRKSITVAEMLNIRYHVADMDYEDVLQSLPEKSEAYRNLYSVLSISATNTKSCIFSAFDQLTRLFQITSSLTNMLSNQTFDMRKLGTEKTAIFLIVPDEKTTMHFLANLFISQCYQSLLNVAEEHNGSLPIKVNMILEEFCNIPRVPDLLAMLTAARSRNIRLHLVIQSYGQLEQKYGKEESRAVLDNCRNLVYLHSRELQFLAYLSELIGKNEYGRPIFSQSQLQRLARNEVLILHDRCYPFLSRDIPLFDEYMHHHLH